MAEISTEQWADILQSVKEEFDITEVTYRTWLAPLKVCEVKDNTVVILVTTGQMGIDYISKKFMFPLKVAIAEITGIEYDVEFILPEEGDGVPPLKTEAERAENPNADHGDKAFEQAMKDWINKIDVLVKEILHIVDRSNN